MPTIEIVEIASFGILAITAIVSTVKFFVSKNKEREIETFDQVDEKFNEFLMICMDKPYLDIFDVEDKVKAELDPTQKKEEKIAFAYLISVFERVYIFYFENGKRCDWDQRDNWTKTILEYFRRENFRKAWMENCLGWDADFIHFMNKLYLLANNLVKLEKFDDQESLKVWYKDYKENFVIDDNNDTYEGLLNYLTEPYSYYFIKDKLGNNIGGILTQDFKNPKATVILYFFINDKYKNKGLGSYAMLTLRNKINKKNFMVAEVENRDVSKVNQLKKWYMKNLFFEVNFDYYTPIIKNNKESDSVIANFLFMNNIDVVKSSDLFKLIKKYHKTSFAHNKSKLIETNKLNQINISKMGRTCELK